VARPAPRGQPVTGWGAPCAAKTGVSMACCVAACRRTMSTGVAVEAVIAWHFPLVVGGYAWPPVGVLETTDLRKLAAKALTDTMAAAAGADLLVVRSRGTAASRRRFWARSASSACPMPHALWVIRR
jgi:hypothetical protein